MELFWQLEIVVNLFLQSLGEWLKSPMSLFSFLGTEEFFLMVLPALYWCVDAGAGFRIAVMLLLSNGINGVLKLAFHAPRPYWFDIRVKALSTETSFGIPSGHAQNSASMWGLMAWLARRKWFAILSVGVIFLIGLSRLYLGVHFLSDVLIGWALGGLLLWGFIRLEKPVLQRLQKMSLEQQLIMILGSSIGWVLLFLLIQFLLRNWQLPQEWVQNAQMGAPDVQITPLSLNGIITIAGMWVGLLGGAAVFYARYGMFNAGGVVWKRLLRYAVGLMGVIVLWYGLGQVFPRSENLIGFGLRYLRYILVGSWVSALAPLLFIRLRLASKFEK
jgi:membrane-associated phospholipid phosphatase